MEGMELQFKSGSLLSEGDRQAAAAFLAKGEVVGIFNRGVCALWFDCGNKEAVKKIWQIKGEGRKSRSLSLTLKLEEFLLMVDTGMLHANVKNLIGSSDFKSKVGSLCFIRAPIKKEYEKDIPHHAKNYSDGVCMVQNWDAHGHEPVEQFLNEVRKRGVKYPAVTSMNITGQPEIVNQSDGEQFAKDHGIPIFLRDPQAHSKHIGSYTIFTFGRKGIILDRDGNIPAGLFGKIFGLPIDAKKAKKPNYPQLDFSAVVKSLTGIKAREAILLYLQEEV